MSEAFESIHRLGVLHGDVHKDNILVRDDGSIMIVDFNRTEISNVTDDLIQMEDRAVKELLINLSNEVVNTP